MQQATQQAMGRAGTGGAYGRFLEMPVPLVLAAMWLAGTAPLGAGVLALHLLAAALGGA